MALSLLSDERLSELIGSIYDAAMDAKQWPAFLDLLASTLNGSLAGFFVQSLATGKVPIAHFRGITDDHVAAYQDHYAKTNVWLEDPSKVTLGCLVTTSGQTTRDYFEGSEFYNDWLKPADMYWAIGTPVVMDDGLHSNITVVRPRRFGDYSVDELTFWRALLPHMRRAVQIHHRLGQAEQQRAAALDTLDHLPTGIMLIDGALRVVAMNRVARRLVQAGDGLSVNAGSTLDTASLSENQRLRALLAGAVQTLTDKGGPPGGAMPVSRPSGARPYSLLAAPLKGDRYDIGARTEARAVLFISDPEDIPVSPPEIMRALYGLTQAEAKVLSHLAMGKRVEDIAGELGLTRETTRFYLKSLFSKTGTTRQAELVRLVLTPALLQPY